MGERPSPRFPLAVPCHVVLLVVRMPTVRPLSPPRVFFRRIDAVDRRTLQERALMAVVSFVVVEHRIASSLLTFW
jgi:hypothetical protein